MARPIATFRYKNHRNVVAERTVTVDSVQWLPAPGFGYMPGWFVSGYCHDKKQRRSFAVCNIIVENPDQLHDLLSFAP